MIIRLDTTNATGSLEDPEQLDRFHVEVTGEGDLAAAVGTFGTLDEDGEHAWISVQAIREAAVGRVDEAWDDRFEAMLGYARSKGWYDEPGAAIRAHLERT